MRDFRINLYATIILPMQSEWRYILIVVVQGLASVGIAFPDNII